MASTTLSRLSSSIPASAARKLGIEINAPAIPVHEAVRGACEILGLDPVHVANEGRFAVFLPADQAEVALRILRGFLPTAAIIGRVHATPSPPVTLRNSYGAIGVLPYLSGEQLPRIC